MATITPVFPNGIATAANLKVANNLIQTTLRVSAASTDTVLWVNSTAGFVPNCLVSIDKEIISISSIAPGPNPSLVVDSGGRGFDGTTAAQHSGGAQVSMFIDAWHHNAVSAEIMAIEAALGPNLSLAGKVPFLVTTDFQFTPQSPGGSLISGTNVITLSPVPRGVNGTDQNHWLYISGGTGTGEAVLITGGTAVGGTPSGTVIVSCANAHAGAWTIQSATAGAAEAFNSSATHPCMVVVPAGDFTWHGPLTTPAITTTSAHHYTLTGLGRETSRINIASDFPLSVAAVITAGFDGTHILNAPRISDLGFIFQQPWSSALSAYTQWPTLFRCVGPTGAQLRCLYVVGAWNGFYLDGNGVGGGQHVIDDIWMSAYHRGIDIRQNLDVTRITKFHFWPFNDLVGATISQQNAFFDPAVCGIYAEYCTGLFISDCFFISGTAIILALGNDAVLITGCMFDGFGVFKISTATGGNRALVTNCFFIQASVGTYSASQPSITVGNGGTSLEMTNCFFTRSISTQPIVSIASPTGSNVAFAGISFVGCTFLDGSNTAATQPMFIIDGTGPGAYAVTISNNMIGYNGDVAYTNPMLSMVGGNEATLSFQGNQNIGFGTGVWLNIPYDGYHNIANNRLYGMSGEAFTVSVPASMLLGSYQTRQFSYNLPAGIIHLTGPTTYGGVPKNTTYVCNAAAGAVAINIPFAATAMGYRYNLIKTDASANGCYFAPGSGDTINGSGAGAGPTTQYGTLSITSDGTGWFKI